MKQNELLLILLLAGGAAAVYFLTKPTTPTNMPVPVYNPYPGGSPYSSQPNPTAQQISAGGQSISSIISALGSSGLFSSGGSGGSGSGSDYSAV